MKERIIVLVIILLMINYFETSAQTLKDFHVIVNKANPIKQISKSRLSKLLLKKSTKWEDDNVVFPVDQKENSPIRKKFSVVIHGRKISAIKAYWQKMIFSGRQIPPPEKENDAAVIKFVKEHTGAIGYVSPRASLNQVKKIKIVD